MPNRTGVSLAPLLRQNKSQSVEMSFIVYFNKLWTLEVERLGIPNSQKLFQNCQGQGERGESRDMPSNQSKPQLPPSQGSTCFQRWQPTKSRFTRESLSFSSRRPLLRRREIPLLGGGHGKVGTRKIVKSRWKASVLLYRERADW